MVDSAVGKTFENGSPAPMGKYAPFARLGHGGMADVFLTVARGPAGFNKLAVVKRLRNPDDNGHLQMFLDEARLSARLSHPNIVNTYEVGESQGKFFIAMEYLEGQPLQSLTAWLAARGEGLSETLAAYVAMQVLKGLHYAHQLTDYDGTPLGVVHRDVSPQNVFLTYQGEVKLLDFGIAKAAMNATHTETGVLKGKVRYMAPEQVTQRNVDGRADVFAVGIVLWEMLARRRLFQGDSISILTRIGTEDAPSVQSILPSLSSEIDAIVKKALQRDVSQRYASADAMRMDLEAFLRGKEAGTDSALARLMNEAFADTRENVRGRIKTFLARVPTPDSTSQSLPALTLTPSTDSLPPLFGEGSDPRAVPSGSIKTPLFSSQMSAPSVTVSSPVAAPPPRSKARIGIAMAVAAVLVGGALFLRSRSSGAPAAAASPEPPPAAKAQVRIETTPPGALVESNGTVLAHTPAELALDPGSQTLMISEEGYYTEQVTLDIRAGMRLERSLMLHPKQAAAPLASAPPSSAVPTASPAPAAPAGRTSWSRPRTPAPAPGPAPSPAQSAPRAKIRVLDDTE